MVFIEKPENVVLGPLWFSGSVFFSFGFPQCRLPFRCHPSAPHHVLYGQKRAARPEVLVCHPGLLFMAGFRCNRTMNDEFAPPLFTLPLLFQVGPHVNQFTTRSDK